MHRLDRARHPAPPCLASYQPGHSWDHVAPKHRHELRSALLAMTQERCAYCEKHLRTPSTAKGWQAICHIEHFRRRHPSHFPQMTFVWENLFISCNDQGSCGKHKDQSAEVRERPFNPADLIKPDDENPLRLLFFTESGEVRPKRDLGLSAADQQRAQETIRVFNLNHPVLRERRRRAANIYRSTYSEIFEMMQHFPPEEMSQILLAEIDKTAGDEFASTIKHLLMPLPPP